MSLLSTIGGMVPAAYQGFQKGADDEVARQQRAADADYQKQQRARATALAPEEDAARVSRLKASIEQDKVATTKAGVEQQMLEDQAKNLPQQLSDAAIARELTSAKTAAEATEGLLAMGGQAVTAGDADGVNRVMGHMIKAGLINAEGVAPPVKSEFVNAPPGSVDFVGQPIQGRAIQATMPDGSTKLVTTSFMEQAFKKRQLAADAASVKAVKPGEKLVVPRTGQVVAEGNDRAYGGLVQDEDGNWVDMRPRAGGAGSAGTGAGKGGKAGATPESAATSAFENIYKNADVKLQASQIADGQDYAVRAARQGASTPEEAARIAFDAAANPSKIVPDLDAATGTWSGVYRNPAIQGGKPFNLAPGNVTVADIEKREGGKQLLQDAANKLIAYQVQAVAPGDSAASADLQAQLIAAANDPSKRAKLLEVAARGGQAEVQALTRKLDLIKTYGPKPAAAKPARAERFSVGGLPSYTPPADSPAGRAAAQRDAAGARRAAEEQKRNDTRAELSKQFKADAQAMEPLALAQKYDAMRGQLPTEDAAALQQIERNIR